MRSGLAAVFAMMLAGCSKPAEPAAPPGPPPPAPEKLHAVVGGLNALCADTWCGGSWDFTFTKLECAAATACTLGFDAKPDGTGVATPETIPLAGFDAVVGTDGNATASFENAVNDAIAEWETKRPAPSGQ